MSDLDVTIGIGARVDPSVGTAAAQVQKVMSSLKGSTAAGTAGGGLSASVADAQKGMLAYSQLARVLQGVPQAAALGQKALGGLSREMQTASRAGVPLAQSMQGFVREVRSAVSEVGRLSGAVGRMARGERRFVSVAPATGVDVATARSQFGRAYEEGGRARVYDAQVASYSAWHGVDAARKDFEQARARREAIDREVDRRTLERRMAQGERSAQAASDRMFNAAASTVGRDFSSQVRGVALSNILERNRAALALAGRVAGGGVSAGQVAGFAGLTPAQVSASQQRGREASAFAYRERARLEQGRVGMQRGLGLFARLPIHYGLTGLGLPIMAGLRGALTTAEMRRLNEPTSPLVPRAMTASEMSRVTLPGFPGAVPLPARWIETFGRTASGPEGWREGYMRPELNARTRALVRGGGAWDSFRFDPRFGRTPTTYGPRGQFVMPMLRVPPQQLGLPFTSSVSTAPQLAALSRNLRWGAVSPVSAPLGAALLAPILAAVRPSVHRGVAGQVVSTLGWRPGATPSQVRSSAAARMAGTQLLMPGFGAGAAGGGAVPPGGGPPAPPGASGGTPGGQPWFPQGWGKPWSPQGWGTGAVQQYTHALGQATRVTRAQQQAAVAAANAHKAMSQAFHDATMGSMSTIFAYGMLAGVLQRVTRFIFQQALAFEFHGVKLKTVLASAEEARDRIGEAVTFALTTPFDVKQVVAAQTMLGIFGVRQKEQSQKWLQVAGDIGATMGQPIEKVAMAMGRAFEGSALGIRVLTGSLGISRMQLRAFGAEVTNAGQVLLRNEDQIQRFKTALEMIHATTFAGGMEERMRTLGGVLTNFVDSIEVLGARMATPLLEPLRIIVTHAYQAVNAFSALLDAQQSPIGRAGPMLGALAASLIALVAAMAAAQVAAASTKYLLGAMGAQGLLTATQMGKVAGGISAMGGVWMITSTLLLSGFRALGGVIAGTTRALAVMFSIMAVGNRQVIMASMVSGWQAVKTAIQGATAAVTAFATAQLGMSLRGAGAAAGGAGAAVIGGAAGSGLAQVGRGLLHPVTRLAPAAPSGLAALAATPAGWIAAIGAIIAAVTGGVQYYKLTGTRKDADERETLFQRRQGLGKLSSQRTTRIFAGENLDAVSGQALIREGATPALLGQARAYQVREAQRLRERQRGVLEEDPLRGAGVWNTVAGYLTPSQVPKWAVAGVLPGAARSLEIPDWLQTMGGLLPGSVDLQIRRRQQEVARESDLLGPGAIKSKDDEARRLFRAAQRARQDFGSPYDSFLGRFMEVARKGDISGMVGRMGEPLAMTRYRQVLTSTLTDKEKEELGKGGYDVSGDMAEIPVGLVRGKEEGGKAEFATGERKGLEKAALDELKERLVAFNMAKEQGLVSVQTEKTLWDAVVKRLEEAKKIEMLGDPEQVAKVSRMLEEARGSQAKAAAAAGVEWENKLFEHKKKLRGVTVQEEIQDIERVYRYALARNPNNPDAVKEAGMAREEALRRIFELRMGHEDRLFEHRRRLNQVSLQEELLYAQRRYEALRGRKDVSAEERSAARRRVEEASYALQGQQQDQLLAKINRRYRMEEHLAQGSLELQRQVAQKRLADLEREPVQTQQVLQQQFELRQRIAEMGSDIERRSFDRGLEEFLKARDKMTRVLERTPHVSQSQVLSDLENRVAVDRQLLERVRQVYQQRQGTLLGVEEDAQYRQLRERMEADTERAEEKRLELVRRTMELEEQIYGMRMRASDREIGALTQKLDSGQDVQGQIVAASRRRMQAGIMAIELEARKQREAHADDAQAVRMINALKVEKIRELTEKEKASVEAILEKRRAGVGAQLTWGRAPQSFEQMLESQRTWWSGGGAVEGAAPRTPVEQLEAYVRELGTSLDQVDAVLLEFTQNVQGASERLRQLASVAPGVPAIGGAVPGLLTQEQAGQVTRVAAGAATAAAPAAVAAAMAPVLGQVGPVVAGRSPVTLVSGPQAQVAAAAARRPGGGGGQSEQRFRSNGTPLYAESDEAYWARYYPGGRRWTGGGRLQPTRRIPEVSARTQGSHSLAELRGVTATKGVPGQSQPITLQDGILSRAGVSMVRVSDQTGPVTVLTQATQKTAAAVSRLGQAAQHTGDAMTTSARVIRGSAAGFSAPMSMNMGTGFSTPGFVSAGRPWMSMLAAREAFTQNRENYMALDERLAVMRNRGQFPQVDTAIRPFGLFLNGRFVPGQPVAPVFPQAPRIPEPPLRPEFPTINNSSTSRTVNQTNNLWIEGEPRRVTPGIKDAVARINREVVRKPGGSDLATADGFLDFVGGRR